MYPGSSNSWWTSYSKEGSQPLSRRWRSSTQPKVASFLVCRHIWTLYFGSKFHKDIYHMPPDPHDDLVLIVLYDCLDKGIWDINYGHIAILLHIDQRGEKHWFCCYCRGACGLLTNEVSLLVAPCNLASFDLAWALLFNKYLQLEDVLPVFLVYLLPVNWFKGVAPV